MKFLKLELSDVWYQIGAHNYYRVDMHNSNYVIGLMLCSEIFAFREDPTKCTWGVYGNGSILSEIADLYITIYGDCLFEYKILDKAKEEIDNFLIKVDKYKLFI